VKYYHNGTAYLQTGGIIETSCDADIKYYPADDHVCEIELYSDILQFVNMLFHYDNISQMSSRGQNHYQS
jgi:hypothetical protein